MLGVELRNLIKGANQTIQMNSMLEQH